MLAALAFLFLLWCLLLLPRRNAPGWEKLEGVRYAHRGLHNIEKGVPENSLPAFRLAVEKGFGAELDVHLLSDGNLAVVHDSDLTRLCGKSVAVEDLTVEDLKDCPLLGTAETIPLFSQVLEIFEGKTPLIIELKAEWGNAAQLTDKVMEALENWQGTYCIESFHPAVLQHLKKHYPGVIRGQLSQDFLRASEVGSLPWPLATAMTYLLTTLFTRPDFIAYNEKDRDNPSLRLMKALYGVREVGWTIRDEGTLLALEAEGVTPIFEGFVPQ